MTKNSELISSFERYQKYLIKLMGIWLPIVAKSVNIRYSPVKKNEKIFTQTLGYKKIFHAKPIQILFFLLAQNSMVALKFLNFLF